MEYAGKMTDVERWSAEGREYFDFVLGGKLFESSGEEARILSKFIDRDLVLVVRTARDAETDLLINNSDHRFVEELREIAPGRFEVFCGS